MNIIILHKYSASSINYVCKMTVSFLNSLQKYSSNPFSQSSLPSHLIVSGTHFPVWQLYSFSLQVVTSETENGEREKDRSTWHRLSASASYQKAAYSHFHVYRVLQYFPLLFASQCSPLSLHCMVPSPCSHWTTGHPTPRAQEVCHAPSCWSHDWLPRPLLTTVHFIIPFPAVHFTITNPSGRNADVRSWTEGLALRIAPHVYTEREENKISIGFSLGCHFSAAELLSFMTSSS